MLTLEILINSFLFIISTYLQITLWRRIKSGGKRNVKDHVTGSYIVYSVIIPGVFLLVSMIATEAERPIRGILAWGVLSAISIEISTLGSPWKLDQWFSLLADKYGFLPFGEDRKELKKINLEQKVFRRSFWSWITLLPVVFLIALFVAL